MASSVASEPGEAAAHCVQDIEQADFVALRLDTSDKESPRRAQSKIELEDFYTLHTQRLQTAPEGRLPLRIGLCCGRWCADQRHWKLRSHEIGLWTGSHLEMSVEVSRARHQQALKQQEATHKRFADKHKHGLPPSKWRSQLANSACWVLAALRSKQVPIIVHEGLADLLQIFDKFEGNAPDGHLQFGRAWMERFPIVFDTCLMAEEDAQNSVGTPAAGDLASTNSLRDLLRWRSTPERAHGSLADLHRILLSAPSWRACIPTARYKEYGLYTQRASSGRNGLVTCSGEGYMARSAMEVAEVFLLLVSFMLQSIVKGEETDDIAKRRKVETASQASATSPTSSPIQSKLPLKRLPSFSEESTTCETGPTTVPPDSRQASAHSSEAAVGGTGHPSDAAEETDVTPTDVASPKQLAQTKCFAAEANQAPAFPKQEIAHKGQTSRVPNVSSVTCSVSPPKKRKHMQSSEKAAECDAVLVALSQRLAGCDGEDAAPSELLAAASSTCRLFQNRVSAVGTPPGYLRLNSLLQVQLARRVLRKSQPASDRSGAEKSSELRRTIFA